MTTRTLLCLCALALIVSSVAFGAPVAANTVPDGFRTELVSSQLSRPTSVSVATDGTIFVTEKAGVLKSFDGPGDSTPTVELDIRRQVHNHLDRGLTGLAVHPNYPSQPFVYLGYALDRLPSGGAIPAYGGTRDYDPCPEAATTGCPIRSRVTRLNVNTGGLTVLFEGHCQQFPYHTFGDLEFDANGNLLASFGDGSAASFSEHGERGNPCGDPPGAAGEDLGRPNTEGGQARSQDILTRDDPTGLAGSLVRVSPTDFSPVAGNPFASDGELNARRMLATGFRNPFRVAVDSETGAVFVGNVGGAGFEEIQQITPGTFANSGWPCYEGNDLTGNTFWLTIDICKQLIESGDHDLPLFTWSRNDTITPGEPCPVGGLSVSGLAVNRSGFGPSSMDGALFFTDYTRHCIWYLPAGPNGPVPNAQLFASGIGSIVDLQFDGDSLWMVDVRDGTLSRIVADSAAPQPPVARIAASVTTGEAPLRVSFDASASTDPDGGALTFAWDFDDDGTDDATGATVSRTFGAPGERRVRLTATDPTGLTDTATVVITVGQAPQVTVVQPNPASRYPVGASVPLSATATFADGSAVPDDAFVWNLMLEHCVPDAGCHLHDIDAVVGATGSFVMPDHEYPSEVKIELTVAGSGGTSTTATSEAQYRTIDLEISSQPSGASVLVGSTPDRTPFTRTVAEGATTDLAAPASTNIGGSIFKVDRWLVGGQNRSNELSLQLQPFVNTPVRLELRPAAVSDSERPTAPERVKAFGRTDGIDLSWNPASDNVGVVRYDVFRSTGSGLGPLLESVNGTATTDGSAEPGVSYTYAVRAVDAAGNSSWRSNFATAQREGGPDLTRPTPPSRVRAAAEPDGLRVTWRPGTDKQGVVEHLLFRSTDRSLGDQIAVLAGDATEYLDGDVRPGVTYTYALRAVDAAGNQSWRSGFGFATATSISVPDTQRPTAPRRVKAFGGSDGISLSWNPASDNVRVVRYDVFRSTDGELGPLLWSVTSTGAVDASAQPGVTYTYAVRAVDAAGNSSWRSNFATAQR